MGDSPTRRPPRPLPVDPVLGAMRDRKPWKCPNCPNVNLGSIVVCQRCGSLHPDKWRCEIPECCKINDLDGVAFCVLCGHPAGVEVLSRRHEMEQRKKAQEHASPGSSDRDAPSASCCDVERGKCCTCCESWILSPASFRDCYCGLKVWLRATPCCPSPGWVATEELCELRKAATTEALGERADADNRGDYSRVCWDVQFSLR